MTTCTKWFLFRDLLSGIYFKISLLFYVANVSIHTAPIQEELLIILTPATAPLVSRILHPLADGCETETQ